MLRTLLCSALLTLTSLAHCVLAQSENTATRGAPAARKIVLVAGETAKQDVLGHHDYLAGCKTLETLLRQTPGVRTEFVQDGWPENEEVFAGAAAVVFYTDGGGKQGFLKTPERIARVQALANAAVGLVCIHQAVDFPAEFEQQAKGWLGGIYLNGKSGRGHWPSAHVEFPHHPITRGVAPWKVNDGWLNELQFVDGLAGVTPLVWSGKVYQGSRSGRDADVVGWAYERPGGGRSFSFTGLDAHSAWSLPGMRRLMVNGILWSAGVEIPPEGAPAAIDEQRLTSYLTPREPKPVRLKN
ncbi:MAG: ThuA domain-containing protein [Planctomycetes bacterium]|nr:ThuA domain-containing protein [Planctomycetota bacterium]